jgi:hypothetical protein
MATELLKFVVFLVINEEDPAPKLMSRAMVRVTKAVTTWYDVKSMLSPQLPEDVVIVGYNNPGQNAVIDTSLLTELAQIPSTPYDAAASVALKAKREYTVFVKPIEEFAFVKANYVAIRLVASNMLEYTPTLWIKNDVTASRLWRHIDKLIPSVTKLVFKSMSHEGIVVARGEMIPLDTLRALPPPRFVKAMVGSPVLEVKVITERFSMGGRRLGSRSRSRSRSKSRSKRTRSKSGAKRRRSGSRRGRAGRAGRR